ncbi:hypothetical protein [Janthinobacterium lividum]|uniref:hypothetical protein n=1 Tax=Janthinobacterium lividum TaxID=29581 RepID=UPI00201DDF62|nr:hypothetical protein [Janthinobacterium lividum]
MDMSILGAVFEFERDLLIERSKAMQWDISRPGVYRQGGLILVRRVGHNADADRICVSECNQVLTFEQLSSDSGSYRVGIYELSLG